MATVGLIGAIVSGVPVLDYAGWFTANTAVASSADFRFVTFNTWYRNRDHVRIAAFLEEVNADVVVLQEITAAETLRLREQLPEYPFAFVTSAKPHGATLLSRWPIENAEAFELTPDGARGAQATIQWRDRRVTVFGVHLHWPLGPAGSRMRRKELEALATRIRLLRGPVLLAGDFNLTPWSQHYQAFIDASGLRDCAAGNALALSWPAQFMPVGISIDHCFTTRHWHVADVRTGEHLGSDHRPLIAELKWGG